MESVMSDCGFHGLRLGWPGISRGDLPKESRRSCSSWSVRLCCLQMSARMRSIEVMVGWGRRDGRKRPTEHRPPPS